MNSPALPHGPGFSFVDGFEIIEETRALRAIKYLDPALSVFADHFPDQPIFPAVLLIEAAAQAAGVLWGRIHLSTKAEPYALAQVVQFKVTRRALPGDTLDLRVFLENDFGKLAQFRTEICVGKNPVASGRLVLAREGA